MLFRKLPIIALGLLALPISSVMGDLVVKLNKLTDLTDSDHMGRSDPYVEFTLKKFRWFWFDKKLEVQTSTKKHNNLNPVYGETFTFKDINPRHRMNLNVRIMDDDIAGLDDKIGKCIIGLKKLGLHKNDGEVVEVVTVVDDKKIAPFYRRLPGTWLFSKIFRRRHAKIHMDLSYT